MRAGAVGVLIDNVETLAMQERSDHEEAIAHFERVKTKQLKLMEDNEETTRKKSK